MAKQDRRGVFVIAEAGVNHNGSLDLGCRLVDAAAEAGANAVKFQTFRADALATNDVPKAAYQEVNDDAPTQREMLRLEKITAVFFCVHYLTKWDGTGSFRIIKMVSVKLQTPDLLSIPQRRTVRQ